MRKGQDAQALEQVDKLLAATPKDRSARFVKGVILTELNRLDEATAVFSELTKEAPELPEPHNNLAVIYAQQKQYDKARAELEMAIRTNPAYATAHVNLGDLYAKMARQAYDRALQIDGSNTSAQIKLNLIRDIISVSAKDGVATKPTAVAAATPAPAAKQATVTPAPAPAPAPTAITPPPATKPVAPVSTPIAAPAPQAVKPSAPAPAPQTPVVKTPPKPVVNDQEEIRKAVLSWAEAWSHKNIREYLGAYARDFDVPGSHSRSAWEKERTERVGKPGAIKVTLSDIRIDVEQDKATVRFRQSYASSNLNATSGKTLIMVRHQGKWLIQQEKIGR